MITQKRMLVPMMMAVFALTACVAQPYGVAPPATSYYRGTTGNMVPATNDASINANVVAAVQRSSGGVTNLQVTTLNGVVTLRGTADSRLVAENDVQAARQVPGVQRVDYDIQILGR